jgi:hypothetical protein
MGAIGRALANSLTTGGVVSASAINNTSVTNVTTLPSGVDTGDLVLISSQTASASATISFTTGLDSTYDEYIFKFIDIHPATDAVHFQFNMSTDGGSNYNVTKTTTAFVAYHNEADTDTGFVYDNPSDLAQSTSYQRLDVGGAVGNDADQTISGSLTLFSPSSTTFVKHFISNLNFSDYGNYANNSFIAGYGNTTSAVNAVRFQMASGNIDDGIIKLYGVKKS